MTLLSPLGHQLPKQWKALTSVACCKSISVKKKGHKSCFWRPPGVIGSVVEEREWGLIQHSVKDAGWDGGTATEVIVQPFIKQWKVNSGYVCIWPCPPKSHFCSCQHPRWNNNRTCSCGTRSSFSWKVSSQTLVLTQITWTQADWTCINTKSWKDLKITLKLK